ncbi:MAG TPA: hypothetical protein VMC61_03285 [Methanocella sp.]|nr:hypothetical protein [Methanocella sp.]
MEMYTIGLKRIVSLSFVNISNALGGLYGAVRALLPEAGGHGAGTETERRAEDARQRYHAQALVTGWQGSRYSR